MHALAPAPNGGLYVATSPDGKIYQVAADGTSKTFFDPDDKYIWALAAAPDGALFAATGEKGNIYRITPDGKGSLFYKTNTTNVVVARRRQERQPDRRNRVARTDLPHRRGRQGVRAARLAVQGNPRAQARGRRDHLRGGVQRRARRRRPLGAGDLDDARAAARAGAQRLRRNHRHHRRRRQLGDVAGGSSAPSRPRPRNAKGAIFRIRPDGLWDTLWEAADDWPFDLLIDTDGSLLVGTGKEGKIFRLVGRSGARDAAGARRRRARSPRSSATRPDGSSPPPAIPARCSRCASTRARDRHLRVRRPRRRHGRDLGRDPLARGGARRAKSKSSRARATPRRPTRPGAPGRRPTPSPTASASRARTRATCSGARC